MNPQFMDVRAIFSNTGIIPLIAIRADTHGAVPCPPSGSPNPSFAVQPPLIQCAIRVLDAILTPVTFGVSAAETNETHRRWRNATWSHGIAIRAERQLPNAHGHVWPTFANGISWGRRWTAHDDNERHANDGRSDARSWRRRSRCDVSECLCDIWWWWYASWCFQFYEWSSIPHDGVQIVLSVTAEIECERRLSGH